MSSGKAYWLGLELHADGTSTWYDGNPSTYRNWSSTASPLILQGTQRCAVFSQNGFQQKPCNQTNYYVAKKVAGSWSLHTYFSK